MTMKNFGILAGLLLSSVSFASELKPLSATCISKQHEISLSFYSHADVMTTGLVDVVVSAHLGKFFGSERYLITDVVASATKDNKTKVYFTNKDVTLDVVIDNTADTASLASEDGKRIDLTCVSN